MPFLTEAVIVDLAIRCGHLSPHGPAQALAAIALHESGGNTDADHINTTGLYRNTHDRGLYQINELNDARLHLTNWRDPCENTRAAVEYLSPYSYFNTGDPQRGFTNGYVMRVEAKLHGLSSDVAPIARPPPEPSVMIEPVQLAKGAQQIMVFDGWSK